MNFCKDRKHCKPPEDFAGTTDRYARAQCGHPHIKTTSQNVVTGKAEINYMLAFDARHIGKCGIEGLLFQQKS